MEMSFSMSADVYSDHWMTLKLPKSASTNDKKLHILVEILLKLHNFSENMAKIDALFTKSLTFLRFILNFPHRTNVC